MGTTGIVLAGGSSRRMGRDKARLRIGGRPVIDRAIDTVAAVCDEVIVAGRASAGAQTISGAVWVEDAPGTAGPLAGLAAGLEAARHERCILVACDMPFLNRNFLTYLASSHLDCDALVPAPHGAPQPLHAAYSRDCLATARALLRLGSASMHDLLERRSVRYVTDDRCFQLDPSGLSWFNMNDPNDYRLASYHWHRLHARAGVA